MTDDTIATLVGTICSTAVILARLRNYVPLSTYQPKVTELHNTINSQGKEIVELRGDLKLAQAEITHLKERK